MIRRRRQWRLVAAATKNGQTRPNRQERRGFLTKLAAVVTISGWAIKDLYQTLLSRSDRPVPLRRYAMDAKPGRYEIRGSATAPLEDIKQTATATISLSATASLS